VVLRPRQVVFSSKRPQGGRMIGIIQQSLDEIEHVAPAAAAPAPEPLGAVSVRPIDARGRPVAIMERTESGPASAPVEAHRHPARLKQVCDTDPLPQRRAKVIISSVHETRIIALRSKVLGRDEHAPAGPERARERDSSIGGVTVEGNIHAARSPKQRQPCWLPPRPSHIDRMPRYP